MLTRGHRLHSVLMHAGLAAALAQSGRIDEAIVHYRRVLELAPNDQVRQALDRLIDAQRGATTR